MQDYPETPVGHPSERLRQVMPARAKASNGVVEPKATDGWAAIGASSWIRPNGSIGSSLDSLLGKLPTNGSCSVEEH